MAHKRFLRIVPAALAVATLLTSAGCREAPREEQQQPQTPAPEPRPQVRDGPPALPIPMPPLDREKLLIAAIRAASAAAAGVEDRARQDELAGERFVFRFRFGCGGPSEEGPRRWTYDREREVLRVEFEPAPRLLSETQPEAEASGAAFTVEQPWLLTTSCPAKLAASRDLPADGQVRLVQPYTEDESRATRLPEIFRSTKRLNPANVPREGLDFVLAGRLEPDSEGRVISCTPSPVGARPDCAISVSVETATLQDPVSGAEYATWGDR
jgi:hypothetical protein